MNFFSITVKMNTYILHLITDNTISTSSKIRQWSGLVISNEDTKSSRES